MQTLVTKQAAGPFWQERLDDLFHRLAAQPEGLTADEAARRLAGFGPNRLASRRQSMLMEFLRRFSNPLMLVLLAASLASFLLGQRASGAIVLVMVVLGALLDFSQWRRSQRAIDVLQKRLALTTTVLRDARMIEVPHSEVVPGDIVHVVSGDIVPADGRLIEAKTLEVDEGTLTGESVPVQKQPASGSESAEVSGASNGLFSGTVIVSGEGRMLVVRTGASTELGRIAGALDKQPPESEYQRGTRRFAVFITRVMAVLILFALVVNLAFHRNVLESILFSVALAVGITPELLPMITSVTLSEGAMRMSRRKVLVKRLAAIHNFGSMDILCTDKTGTLTQGSLLLSGYLSPLGVLDEGVLRTACLNSYFQTGSKSPLDAAILAHRPFAAEGCTKVDEVPFDFTRRRLSVIVRESPAGAVRLFTKGAPESVLSQCSQYRSATEVLPLEPGAQVQIEGVFNQLSGGGYRALGVASRDIPVQTAYSPADEAGLTFEGFVTFLDPPKPDAGQAIAGLEADGVSVKILTGDNENVARTVCVAVGMEAGDIISGKQLDGVSDAALGELAERTKVFARLNPQQKNRLILALKARGHVVGFLGDGINDAPSLHAADVGISVDNAVDVAKESASIILLEHDLRVLHQGVLEGRKAFGNVMKYILMGTSSNFGNMFSMAGATLLLPFLPMLPLQILLNNLLYDVSQVTIPQDAVDESYIQKPRHWDMKLVFRFMVVIGPVSSLYDFLTFFVMARVFHAPEALFHTGWFVESLTTQVLVIYVIRTVGSPFSSRPSWPLVFSTLSCVALGVVLPFSPFAGVLGFAPLPLLFFGYLAAAVVTYLMLVQLVKAWFYKGFGAESKVRLP